MPAELNFDATGVKPTSPFEPVPNGEYRAHIVESEVKPTQNGKGKYLQLTWEILDGEYKGRKIWDRLNIVNENAQAQEIAQRALSAICHATGVLKLTNSQQLHGRPALVKVRVTQDAGYDPKNEVKGYKPVDGSTPTTAAAAPAPAPAAPVVPPENVPAWARKAS